MQDHPGRPTIIDEQSMDDITRELIIHHKEQDCFKRKRLHEVICREVNNTNRRRGHADNVTKIGKSTFTKLIGKLEATPKSCQAKPVARIVAELDPRNAYSMACMVLAFCDDLDEHLIINWDATQFVLEGDGDSIVYTVKSIETEDIPVTSPSDSQLDFGIKLYHCHCAAGRVVPPVFVIADDSMDADALSVNKIEGLANTNGSDAEGYLCFTKTRCCNAAFYRWFIREIVCPFVVTMRKLVRPEVIRTI